MIHVMVETHEIRVNSNTKNMVPYRKVPCDKKGNFDVTSKDVMCNKMLSGPWRLLDRLCSDLFLETLSQRSVSLIYRSSEIKVTLITV